MSLAVFYKLLALLATIALGWWVQRKGWLKKLDGAEQAGDSGAVVEVLGNAVLYLFIPALLFRTLVRQDLSALPVRMLAAYFVPALIYTLSVYAWLRFRSQLSGAGPATRSVAAVYGNSVQLGIPMVTALFGEPGLALHIAVISVHGLVLLTTLTVLAETDLARSVPAHAMVSRWATLVRVVRKTVVHPLLLPVIAGLLWNLLGLGLHPVLDDVLRMLSLPVVPLSLLLIGMSLALTDARSGWREVRAVVALKLLVLPALVLLCARYVFGLQGMPLGVLVMMAALPVGSNALIFAQRYNNEQSPASVAIVVSVLAFMLTAGFWLAVLGAMG